MKQKQKKILAAGVIAFAVLFMASILHAFGALNLVNLKLSNSFYHEREIADNIVIVAIDEKTLFEPDQGGLGGISLWTKSIYTKVLNEIENAGAKVVMFDLLFQNKSDFITVEKLKDLALENPKISDFSTEVLSYIGEVNPDDLAFAAELKKYNNVFLIKNSVRSKAMDYFTMSYENAIEPLDIYAESAYVAFASLSTSENTANTEMVYGFPYRYSKGEENPEKHITVQVAESFIGTNNEVPPLEDSQILINYAKKPFGYPMVSFVDIYEGKVPNSMLEDKIILVGVTATAMQDFSYTPIDEKHPMARVEIHANAIQTMLDGEYLRHMTLAEFAIFLGLIAGLAVAAFMYLPVLWGAAVLILEIAVFPFIAKIFFANGIILDLIWPVFAIFAAYLAVIAYRNFTEFAEKRKLRNAFAHYVSKDLIENVISNPDALKLGGDRRELSVLFLDIENFTTLSESGDPAKVVEVINNYFDALSNLIMEEGGTVDKFEGDAIMALFGAPLPCNDHAVKACAAALKIREKMAELNTQFGYNLNVRVGVGTGDAIVGNMGSRERFDYTAMGDTVNTASRLEGINKFYKTRILVMQKTVDGADATGGFFFREVDTICPKGKNDSLRIHELMGVSASEEGRKVVAVWNEALAAYRNGNWSEAEEKLDSVLAVLPDDGPSKTLLERIREFKIQPPASWDGVWRFKEK